MAAGPALVTGATGTVGGQVVRALLAHGAPLRVAMRRPERGPSGVEAVRFDFAEPATYQAALAGARSLFLLFPPSLPRAADRFAELMDAARAAGVERVVFHSVRGAGRLPLPHRKIERVVQAGGVPWTLLRPNDFMQNFATVPVFRDGIARRGVMSTPAGVGRTSYIDVRDIGDAAVKVLTEDGHDGCTYTLTGPEALDLAQVAARLGRVLEKPVRYEPASVPGFVREVRALGNPLPLALIMTSIALIARFGLAAEVDPTLPQLLGKPARGFDAFARDYSHIWSGYVATGVRTEMAV
ncbi:MAG: hypothetical protein AVDCRST_MAG39-2140 [uncultured Sphingomonadaceae bacterium]|uniref:NmrA-like domain-containing protein n=1 Tax=uncultured Sphingomonadaceae bacterium TaxID=169976 RepID=A0A6J4T386_9SPHN|nr:MAG: hypothetical protein AVDCRST_MAG39-2140 [uncultured Sphingomonadaceae bacterium]